MNRLIVWEGIKETFSRWNEHNVPRLSAALAFYTVFSLAPLLVIVISIAGLAFGQKAAEGEILLQVKDLVGWRGGAVIETVIQSAHKPSTGVVALAAGVIVLLFSASGVFGELHAAL